MATFWPAFGKILLLFIWTFGHNEWTCEATIVYSIFRTYFTSGLKAGVEPCTKTYTWLSCLENMHNDIGKQHWANQISQCNPMNTRSTRQIVCNNDKTGPQGEYKRLLVKQNRIGFAYSPEAEIASANRTSSWVLLEAARVEIRNEFLMRRKKIILFCSAKNKILPTQKFPFLAFSKIFCTLFSSTTLPTFNFYFETLNFARPLFILFLPLQ